MGQDPSFSGVVSDIGGPTANMYQMRCTRPEVEAKCKRLSCVHPKVCKLLGTDHGPLVELMRESREVPGIDKVFVASGIRMDLAQQVAGIHGRAGQAPRRRPSEGRARAHRSRTSCKLMKKPDSNDYRGLRRGLPEGQQRRRARSNSWCPISSPRIPAAT